MVSRLRGRQTQFYIDIVYGVVLAAGFGYLMFVGMDGRVAAFQGGLILGYVLRVWENMSVYERILEEEIAQEAETQVAEEIEEQVPTEAEAQVAEEIEEQIPGEAEAQVAKEVEEQVPEGVEERVAEEVEEQVGKEVEAQVDREVEERVAAEEEQVVEEAETELLDRLGEVDEELAAELRKRLEEEA